jgi:hypothetical protein
MPAGQLRHLVVLGIGFSASVVVSSKVFGPYVAYDGQPLFQQILTIFLLPTTASVVYLLLRSLQRRRPVSAGDTGPDLAVEAIVFWILFFLIGVHAIVLSVLVGLRAAEPWASRAVVMLLGLTLVAIGNLLPRTRPNIALGIRTARTLTDRRLWMLTHRAGGYICVAVGVVTALAGALLPGPTVAGLSGGAVLVGAAIMFVYYQKLSHV